MKQSITLATLLVFFSATQLLAQNPTPTGHCVPPTPDVNTLKQLPPPSLMTGIGRASMTITTQSKQAQQYFNQGLALFHCFWWNEALHSFQEATRLDPDCAMAYWGMYQVLANPWGSGEADTEKMTALEKAKALSARVSAREQAYIHAAVVRESSQGENGYTEYINEMERLIAQYPDDVQAKLFLAVFLFQTGFPHGFDLSGQPTLHRKRSMELVRDVLKAHPNDAAANHYWIHVTEGGPSPQSALKSARLLSKLAPRSGHMIHMPGHIFFRLGQYEQSRQAFLHSMQVEKAYMARSGVKPELLWNYTHNLAYLAMNCAEDGRYQEGLKWVGTGGEQANIATFNMRYGFWEKAAQSLTEALPQMGAEVPPFIRTFQEGLLAFNKGMAAVEKSDEAEASRQAAMLEQAFRKVKAETPVGSAYGLEFLPSILATALPELRGLIQSIKGDHAGAVALLKEAIEKEKEVGYEEPPPYPRPVYESLGQAYLRAKAWEQAREAFQQALQLRPHSGHALFGIAQSYDLAGQKEKAVAAYQVFLRSWRFADPDLPQVKMARAKIQEAHSLRPHQNDK